MRIFSEEEMSLFFFSPILAAVYLGNLEMVKLFIEKGKVDVNMKQLMLNLTQLYFAVARGHHDIVEYLISKVRFNSDTVIPYENLVLVPIHRLPSNLDYFMIGIVKLVGVINKIPEDL